MPHYDACTDSAGECKYKCRCESELKRERIRKWLATFLHQWWEAWKARGFKIIRTTCEIQNITVAVIGKSNKCSGEPLENMISELAFLKMHAVIGNDC